MECGRWTLTSLQQESAQLCAELFAVIRLSIIIVEGKSLAYISHLFAFYLLFNSTTIEFIVNYCRKDDQYLWPSAFYAAQSSCFDTQLRLLEIILSTT